MKNKLQCFIGVHVISPQVHVYSALTTLGILSSTFGLLDTSKTVVGNS